jgi:hypothetical protein
MKAAGQRLSTAGDGFNLLGDGRNAFVAFKSELVFFHAWHCWEIAMSELRQQTIALWILFMLLLMIPWILE